MGFGFSEPVGWYPLDAASGRINSPTSQGERDGEELPLQGRNILIAEDESLIALLISDALEEAGATPVGPCYTLSECLKVAAADAIDAAVLDVDLGGFDVFPVADELERRGIPFVFHTAHAYREDLHARFGDVLICRKPIDMDDLVAVLARLASPDPTN